MWLLWIVFTHQEKRLWEEKFKIPKKTSILSLCMRLTWMFTSKADLDGKKGKTWGKKIEKAISLTPAHIRSSATLFAFLPKYRFR